MFILEYIWHSVAAQIGIGGLVIAGMVAIAWFIPPFRKIALEVAGALLAVLAIYIKGASDASKRAREKAAALAAAQEAARRRSVEQGKSDRTAAEHDAAGGVSDGYDRDNLNK